MFEKWTALNIIKQLYKYSVFIWEWAGTTSLDDTFEQNSPDKTLKTNVIKHNLTDKWVWTKQYGKQSE